MSMVRPTRFAGLGVMGELVHFSVSPVLRSIPGYACRVRFRLTTASRSTRR
jgi:hypothetical protein